MAIYQINYGSRKVQYNDFGNLNCDFILPDYFSALDNPQERIKSLLENPDRSDTFEKKGKDSWVAIAINDQTRPVPHEKILPTLIDFLKNQGYANKDIRFFIATGTHKSFDINSLFTYLSLDIVESFDFSFHDCDDINNLSYLGKTNLGTPVYINSNFLKADIRIVIGNIEPHHFQGFSGGAKTAAIGLAGRETIDENHKWLMDSRSFIGNYENNPCRQDLEEIGDMIGINVALNVVLNQDKEIFDAFLGSPRAVMAAGIPVSKRVCQKYVSKQYDLVITSPGGYPKDINLYQSQKAITHAGLIAKKGGVIILLAECSQGLGNSLFENYLDGMGSFLDVIEKYVNSKFSVGPHKAYQLAQQALRNQIILVSVMSDNYVKKTMLKSADSLKNALSIAGDYLPEDPEIAILPFATNTIPLLE